MKNSLVYILIGAGAGALTLLLKYSMITSSVWAVQALQDPLEILGVLFVSGLLVAAVAKFVSPDVCGPGLDVGLLAFKTGLKKTSLGVPVAKYFATLFTVGLWGSGGFIGPLAYIGQGLSSVYARYAKLTEQQAKTLALCAMGAVFTAMFGAPLASCLMALELRFIDKVEYGRLVPVLLACVASHLLCVNLLGQGVLQSDALVSGYETPLTLEYVSKPLNVISALGVSLFVCCCCVLFAGFYGITRKAFRNLPVPLILKPAIGMLLAGIVALTLTESPEFFLTSGRDFFTDQTLEAFSNSAQLCVMVVIVRIVTTALTVGSGGSGGMVWPTILVGLMAGLSGMHLLGHSSVNFYAATGVAVALTVLIDVPIAAIVLVVETIGGAGGAVIVPATIGALVGHIVGRRALRFVGVELLEQLDSRQSYLPEVE